MLKFGLISVCLIGSSLLLATDTAVDSPTPTAAADTAPAETAPAPTETTPISAETAPADTTKTSNDKPVITPSLLAELNDFCPSPESAVLTPWGDLLISCPNLSKPEYPALIIRVTPENKVYPWLICPVNPVTGMATPAGMSFGSDGNLYLVDSPAMRDGKSAGRIFRIAVNDKHRPVGCEVAAYDIPFPNQIKVHEGFLFVTGSVIEKNSDGKVLSGVYRFPIDTKGVKVTPSVKDPYVFGVMTTQNPAVERGAVGLCFNSDGDLLVGNYGDGKIYKITFDMERIPADPVLLTSDSKMNSCGSMAIDENDNIYAADTLQNAIAFITSSGNVSIVARNADNNTANGGLNQPSSVCFRDKELIIVNSNNPIEKKNAETASAIPASLYYIDTAEQTEK